MKITFLGGGNMANALIGGMLDKGVPASAITVIEINEQNHEPLRQRFGVKCVTTPTAEVFNCDVLLLAVKPQQLRAAVEPFSGKLREQLVISIAAGIRLGDLSRWLGGYTRLVRAMPNTPALIGAGVTGLFALPGVAEPERRGAEKILQAVGTTLWVADEGQIDAVTAISGSGPAYAFLLIEAMQQAAAELGFSPEQARQLSIDTVLGAAKLAQGSEESAAILRERVTSKGGTTEAALRVMAEHGVREAIAAGALAAAARSRELGEQFGRD
ncbi:pyrroline-5-carboxylate reductase [Propionivibrio dicarboxylicus]|uniref:Pyrroline-5-carboxylate reductase n=1 Tax=Propionivibrio dicarboxylicus TaxID=83767 RepID=A0A1G7WYQ6_9RHOO|nr:pyrroline-5-carboxylate reductase [Propionivibrio dicarboxylicus]SDG77048.1 pyrroline-5-carboxylate reductase [Propionivibrio dicarboxylicus]